MSENSKEKNALIFSYLHLRKTIGILGIILPFVLYLGVKLISHKGLQSSLSSYYYTNMGDVFVGTLCVIGFFLFSYKGYESIDDVFGDIAGFFAVGMALFPTFPKKTVSGDADFIGYVHLFCAAVFFFTLIYFSLKLFTKRDKKIPPTAEKLFRNKIYKFCGYTMIFCVVTMGIIFLLPEDMKMRFKVYNTTFWLESIAIIVFGFSWLIKGETLWKDKPEAS